MHPGSGAGNPLEVTIRLDDGEECLFDLDTGASMSLLDISLEPKLGPRLRTVTLWRWGKSENSGTYASPGFSLGGVLLRKTGRYVFTTSLKDLSPDDRHPLLGLIGMDVLKHYCLQLDFTAGQIRFLDDRHADKRAWGTPFPLHDVGDGCPSILDNLAGAKDSGSLIDTGCNYDGWLTAPIFQQWTNQLASSADDLVRFPDVTLGGELYPHALHVHCLGSRLPSSGDSHMRANGIGLHTLSRNLVTFDFPHHIMYLKRVSMEPLAPESTRPALAAFEQMRKDGRLPGWPKNDPDPAFVEPFFFPNAQSVIVTPLLVQRAPSLYRYFFQYSSRTDSWTLHRAGRSDLGGGVLEEFPVP